jgi:hypothetical protein
VFCDINAPEWRFQLQGVAAIVETQERQAREAAMIGP